MPTTKIAITMDQILVKKVDKLVSLKLFPNRSKAIQSAVEEKILRCDRNRLNRECAKLDPDYEQGLAEEGMGYEVSEWPKY